MTLLGVLALDIARRSNPLLMKSFLIPKENDDISVGRAITYLLVSQGGGANDHLTQRAQW